MKKMAPAILVPLLVLTISFQPNKASAANSDTVALIEETCKKTLHYNGCLSSLEAGAGSQKVDLKGLAIISLMLAQKNASETAEFIKGKIEKASDPYLQQGLNDCFDHYLDAVEQLEDSLALLANNVNNDDMRDLITAAISDIEACEESFKNHPSQNVLDKDNDDLFMLCTNALSIVKQLSATSQPTAPDLPSDNSAKQSTTPATEDSQEATSTQTLATDKSKQSPPSNQTPATKESEESKPSS